MNKPFLLDRTQFARLFPFYVLLNRDLKITGTGPSFQKIFATAYGADFYEHFTIKRPSFSFSTFSELLHLQNQLVIIENKVNRSKLLRGQFEYLADTDELVFICTPRINDIEDVRENNLQINDFAYYDPLVDYLHILKSKEVSTNETIALINRIHAQKKELEKANKQVHDISLFPTQNPDPLIRINFSGDVLLNNPSASQLDFFEYDHKRLRNDEFFKIVAEKIDKHNPRWTIEAIAEGKVYSFLCVTMWDEQYINIYGRDISDKKATEKQLQRLSLVASANENAVLFTDLFGRITWVNEGFCELTGYSFDEIIGKSPIELCNGPLTDETEVSELLNSFFKGEGFSTDIVYYRKDKSWFWGKTFAQPLRNEQGTVTEFFGIIEDITQSKETEEKLKVLSTIAEDNINPVFITDKDGKITWVNQSFTKQSGYTKEEAIGKRRSELLRETELNKRTIDYLNQQIESGLNFNTELVDYHNSGEEIWLRIMGQPVLNDKGVLNGYFSIEENITEERQAENRLKRVMESLGDNVWEHNFISGITTFSKQEQELLGHIRSEYSSNQELWWNSVHKDDLHLLIENDRRYKAGEINSHSIEYRIVHKDGTTRWVLDRGVVIEKDRDGKPLRITGTHTDITVIKQTEIQLANRVKQFNSLAENMPGVIYEYEFRQDGKEGVKYVSPAFRKLFKVVPDSYTTYMGYIHPDDLALIGERGLHSRNTLEPFYVEVRVDVPGEEMRWHALQSAFSYQTDKGDLVFTGLITDITEQKKAAQKLDEQRQFYENILNLLPADIAVFNERHEYLFVNPKAIKDDELRSWIIGKRDEDYCRYRNKPLQLAKLRREKFNEVVNSKMPSEWEEKNVLPDGSEEYVLRRWFPVLDNQQKVALIIGYGLEITERKNAEQAVKANEEKYRSIIANMNLGLMEVDKRGRINFANHMLLKMTGMTETEAIGYNAMQFLSAESLAVVENKLRKRPENLSEAYEVEAKVNGRKGWWLLSTAPKFSARGELLDSIVICLDVTKQKQLEHELIQSRERAEHLAKAKETFLANMSHEIRTPMNAIMGMGNQLAKTLLTEQQHFYLKTINTAAENLLVIINDILDLSKIEAGKLSIEKIGFEPRKVLSNALQVLMHKAEEKGLKLTSSHCDTRLADVLIGDPYRLNQIMLNLISNAIKFTETGTVDVRCEILKDTERVQIVRSSVIDTGIGMDQQFVEQLFDKFSQEYVSNSRTYGGTGLGMSITKDLVSLMGGKIIVNSERGKGTTVQIEFEFLKGTTNDLPEIRNSVITNDFLKGKTILITDDNDMNRLVATTILQSYGAVVEEAANGEEAITQSANCKPDLILMDIQMPVMNGYDASRQLRKLGSKAPIIALTANAIRGENEKCLAAGMNDYIAKPFKEEEFLKMIAQWLDAELVIEEKGIPPEIMDQSISASYDLSRLQSMSNSNEAFVRKMLQLFCEKAPATVAEIKTAYAHNEMEVVQKLAHRLKPSIDNLGIYSIKQHIREIEQQALSYGQSEKLSRLIQDVEKVVTQVKIEFEDYLK